MVRKVKKHYSKDLYVKNFSTKFSFDGFEPIKFINYLLKSGNPKLNSEGRKMMIIMIVTYSFMFCFIAWTYINVVTNSR